jgi:DegV family protein with EDD domain
MDIINSINSEKLVAMMLKSSSLLEEKQEELNNINVFPVADGDTGANMAYTMKMVKEAILEQSDLKLVPLGKLIYETALINSRGNSGTVLSQFLKGFLGDLEGDFISPASFVKHLDSGAKMSQKSFLEPKAGTILDVMDAAVKGAKSELRKNSDLISILESALSYAKEALDQTRNFLPQLQRAGVVDAGGAGFLIILTGFLSCLKDEDIAITTNLRTDSIGIVEDEKLQFKYCTELVIRDSQISPVEVQKLVHELGDSIQVIESDDFIKLHLHTNEPDEIHKLLSEHGQIDSFKAEDMADMQSDYIHGLQNKEEVIKPASSFDPEILQRYSTIVITDSSSDIPAVWFERYPIKILNLPILLNTDNKIDISKNLDLKSFYTRMETEENFIPKTSKVNAHIFYNAYQEALKSVSHVICLPLSSQMSATYESAVIAKQMLHDDPRIQVIDTQTSSSGLSILIDYIFQSIEKDLSWDEILKGVEDLKSRLNVYFLVDDVKYLQRGGRITRAKAGLAKLLNIQPLLKLENGKIEADSDKILFSSETKKINLLFKKLKKANNQNPIANVYIVFAGDKAEAQADKLIQKIEYELGIPRFSVHKLALNPVVGAHAGPGSLGIIFV